MEADDVIELSEEAKRKLKESEGTFGSSLAIEILNVKKTKKKEREREMWRLFEINSKICDDWGVNLTQMLSGLASWVHEQISANDLKRQAEHISRVKKLKEIRRDKLEEVGWYLKANHIGSRVTFLAYFHRNIIIVIFRQVSVGYCWLSTSSWFRLESRCFLTKRFVTRTSLLMFTI